MAIRIRTEQRVEVPKWLPTATSVGSVIIAFILGGVIFKIFGGKPFQALSFFYQAVFGNWGVFSDTLVKLFHDYYWCRLRGSLQNALMEYWCGRSILCRCIWSKPGCPSSPIPLDSPKV